MCMFVLISRMYMDMAVFVNVLVRVNRTAVAVHMGVYMLVFMVML